MFSSRYEHVVEWGDCDPAGIVFYPRFFAMFDAATAHLFETASGRTRAQLIKHYAILGWPMVDVKATFHGSVTFDDRIVVESLIARVGRSSLQVSHRLLLGGKLCVEAVETRVWCVRLADEDGMAAAPIPDTLRQRLLEG